MNNKIETVRLLIALGSIEEASRILREIES